MTRSAGHYVQGHVDGVGSVRSVELEGDGTRVWIDAEPELLRYLVEKGSITVEGVSLTVAELAEPPGSPSRSSSTRSR